MTIDNGLINKISSIFTSSRERKHAQYAEFFAFYKRLVEETDSAVAKAVGNMTVAVFNEKREQKEYILILSATDYMWWRQHLGIDTDFVFSTESVKAHIARSIAQAAELNTLTTDERKQLVGLLDQVVTNDNGSPAK